MGLFPQAHLSSIHLYRLNRSIETLCWDGELPESGYDGSRIQYVCFAVGLQGHAAQFTGRPFQ